jgi:starvation-inducible DNA-binding protein
MADETVERVATLGGSPCGTPGALVAQREWDDYSIGRAGTLEHLGALDVVYAGIIEAHRRAADATEDLDLERGGHLHPATCSNGCGVCAAR